MRRLEPTASLPIFCAHCGSPVELICALDDREDLTEESWTCPWCESRNTCGMGGEIIEVKHRYEDRLLGRLLL